MLIAISKLFFLSVVLSLFVSGCSDDSNKPIAQKVKNKIEASNKELPCLVDELSFGGSNKLLTIVLSNKDVSYDINSLATLKLLSSVRITGKIKRMPDFTNSSVVDFALDAPDNTWIFQNGDLSNFINLRSLSLSNITAKEFRQLRFPRELTSLAIDFRGDMEIEESDFENLPKLEHLMLGSFSGNLKIKSSLKKSPQISTLMLWGNCSGYERILQQHALKQVSFLKMVISQSILKTAEFKKIHHIIIKDSSFE